MANERNKILPYALSAIEGVNIQSQEDYSASSETTDGVSTGLANGNNFNKLAKQVSIMSSSLAEFIVNTLAEQTISDTNSIEEISSALNSAILKLIKDNEPAISDKSGITVIDDNNTDITSFNQIKEDGIYYIYKQLSDGPSQNGEAIKYNFIHLIVINASVAAQNFEMCMQMTSFGPTPSYPILGNVGTAPMLRSYNKTSKQWLDWDCYIGITFTDNNILISDFNAATESKITFPIIAKDNNFPSDYNTFMYSATKAQMRAQLGIADSPDLTNYFNKTTDKINLASQVTGQLKNANIEDNAITTSKIASLAITADKLALSSVTNDKIANGAVTSAKIASKTITASNIADNAITQSELASNAVVEAKIASNAVTTDKIKDASVTDAKISGVISNAHGGLGAAITASDGRKITYIDTTASNTPENAATYTGRYRTNQWVNYPTSSSNGAQGELYNYNWNEGNAATNNGWGYQEYITPIGEVWYRSRNYSKYAANTGWKKLRNVDGSIPADLIPPTVLTYTNDQGTWTETKLSDGTTMLEGCGYRKCVEQYQANNISGYIAEISIPKQLNKALYINSQGVMNYSTVSNIQVFDYRALYMDNTNKIKIERYYRNTSGSTLPSYININWYMKGILA